MPEIPDYNSIDPTPLNAPSAWPTYLFLLAVAIFLYMFLFELPATPFFGDADQSIFLYEAERMFNGEVMYRDFFEFTLPGTQVFYALMFAIFGVKFWIVGAAVLVLGVTTAGLILAISKRILPSPLCFLPATIFIFFGFRWVGFDGSHRMFSPVFVLLAIWLLMKGKSTRNLILAGCSLAVASFFTQQRGFVVLAATFVYFLIEKIYEGKGKNWSNFLRSSAIISTTFVVILTALCIYFVIAAGPENFFYATLTYPFKYYGYGHPNHFGVYFIDLKKALAISKPSDILALAPVILYSAILPFVNLVLLLIFIRKRKAIEWELWRGPLLIAITGFFLTISTTAPNMFRLFQIAGATLISLVWLFHKFGPGWKIKKRFAYAAIIGLMMLGTFQAVRVQTNWDSIHLDSPVGRLALVKSEQADRYVWLSKNTSPGDYFFEVYEPFVYFPLGLKNPTKVGQFWPSEYTRPEQVAEAVIDLSEKRPKYILWDNSYNDPIPRATGDYTAPLADLVQEKYKPIGAVYDVGGKPVQIWERKD